MEIISAVLDLFWRDSVGYWVIPSLRAIDTFVDSMQKLLDKQLGYMEFDTPWRSCDAVILL